MQDEECRKLYQTMMEVDSALENPSPIINIDEEWEKFSQEHQLQEKATHPITSWRKLAASIAGFVRIHLPGKKEVEQVFVAGGVLEVQPDLVTVLADTAVRSNDLDEAKAAKALEDARAQRQNATGEIEIARLEAEMAALAAQIVAIKKIRQQR